jgi:hypothetical protein
VPDNEDEPPFETVELNGDSESSLNPGSVIDAESVDTTPATTASAPAHAGTLALEEDEETEDEDDVGREAANTYAVEHFHGCGAPQSTEQMQSRGTHMLAQLRARASGRDIDTEDDSYDESGDDEESGWGDNAYGETYV